MKIVFLSRILFLSGVTVHMRDLAKELIRQGHAVTILTSGPQFKNHQGMNELVDSLMNIEGVKIIKVDYPSKGRLSYFKLITSFISTYKILKKEKFDIIHVHTAVLSFMPKILGYKFVTTIHVANLKLGIFQSKPTQQIAISREVYNESLRRGINPSNLSLIFNGVDKKYKNTITAQEKDSLKERYSLPKKKILIGFVGTLCYRKGLDILVESIAKLDILIQDKIHIVLLGNFDSYQNQNWLDSIIQKHKMNDRISVIPFCSPEYLYKLFDIFVLPSRLEGFPLVVIEAMLSGCCCVRSNVEGAYDQIEDGKNGLLFENENVEQLSSILEYLIEHPDRRMEIAKVGRETALEKFTSETMAKKTLEVYKKAIN